MSEGVLIISLDFEMMWGAIFNEKVKKGYLYRTEYIYEIIDGLLKLFKKYSIHATWAAVGAIACKDAREANLYACSEIKDPYGTQKLKEFISQIDQRDYYRYFAPNLLQRILEVENQEIGTHTFSHFYYDEHDDAKTKVIPEILESVKVLEKISNQKIQTLVMPKNQVSSEMGEIMRQTNLRIIRGKQKSKRFNKKNVFFRIARFADAYIPVCGSSTYSIKDIYRDGLYNIRASCFWRTYYKKLGFLEPLKLHRIKKQMKYAAKKGEIFHIWFHPHNLSSDYKRNLRLLEIILSYYNELSMKYGMSSLNMKECAALFDEKYSNL